MTEKRIRDLERYLQWLQWLSTAEVGCHLTARW
jgi:hypothetical protein